MCPCVSSIDSLSVSTQKQMDWRLGREASASRCLIGFVECGASGDSPFAL